VLGKRVTGSKQPSRMHGGRRRSQNPLTILGGKKKESTEKGSHVIIKKGKEKTEKEKQCVIHLEGSN